MSAYVIDSQSYADLFGDLAVEYCHGDLRVELHCIQETEMEEARVLLNDVIEKGNEYPQRKVLDQNGFRAYFLSHDAFSVSRKDTKEVVGIFYIKPNFPGRCSHICNGGFIVKPAYRLQGIGRFMAQQFLKLARKAGYLAVFFNLVFISNAASMQLWPSLGFVQTGTVPRAGLLRTGNGDEEAYVDAAQFYYDLTSLQ